MSEAAPAAPDGLRELAWGAGIATGYHDIAGVWREPDPDVLRGVLGALGLPSGDAAAIAASHRELHRRAWATPVEATTVCWDGRAPAVEIRRPAARAESPVEAEVTFEDGTVDRRVVAADHLVEVARADLDGVPHVAQRVPLGDEVPLGAHRVKVAAPAAGGTDAVGHLLAAPMLAPAPRRGWGVFAPVYALRRDGAPRVGHLGDLAALGDWLHDLGGDLVGTLPLLATFDGEASPYAPVSRVAWNERHLDLAALPEAEGGPGEPTIGGVPVVGGTDRLIDWAAEVARVRAGLATLVGRLSDARRAELDAFCAARPHVDELARWRVEVEAHGPPAPGQPLTAAGARGAGDPDGVLRHRYAQWAMETQLADLHAHLAGHGQSLYLDLPLGVHADGFDVWRAPGLFARTIEVGAPPDEFNPAGQGWGFPPLLPPASRADGHAYLRAGLAHQLRHAGVVRIDHVMALHRLWWIPDGGSAAAGAYVHYPAEELAAVVTLEAWRAGAVVVGENLGTVPPEVDELLGRHRLLGMYATQFELDAAPHARWAPPTSVAVVNTHDMAPFAAFWGGLDDDRRARILEQLTGDGAAPEGTGTEDVLAALLGWLGRTDAASVVVSLEDLWGETLPQNVPGTGPEVPNWRRQMARTLDEVDADPEVADRLAALRAARGSATDDRVGAMR